MNVCLCHALDNLDTTYRDGDCSKQVDEALPPRPPPPIFTTRYARMSKITSSAQSSTTLLLRRQLVELSKRPVEGFSAGQSIPAFDTAMIVLIHSLSPGLADDDNLLEWEVLIIGYVRRNYLFRNLIVYAALQILYSEHMRDIIVQSLDCAAAKEGF